MLVLFDIDGTLLLSRGAGMQCFLDAGRDLFAREQHDRFRATYAEHLRARMAAGNLAFALPGVPELLAALGAPAASAERDPHTVGLLTGNYPETGELKLRAAGFLMDQFAVAAWGCDGGHRRELVPVALRRYAEATGRSARGEEVVIVGDTPHDIDCAAAHGCRSLGVATGAHPVEELAACGATRAVADLSDTADILAWLAG